VENVGHGDILTAVAAQNVESGCQDPDTLGARFVEPGPTGGR
jgi:hypothetical protein